MTDFPVTAQMLHSILHFMKPVKTKLYLNSWITLHRSGDVQKEHSLGNLVEFPFFFFFWSICLHSKDEQHQCGGKKIRKPQSGLTQKSRFSNQNTEAVIFFMFLYVRTIVFSFFSTDVEVLLPFVYLRTGIPLVISY